MCAKLVGADAYIAVLLLLLRETMEKELPSSSLKKNGKKDGKKDGTRVFKKASPNGKLVAREQVQAVDGQPAVEDLSFGPWPGLSPAPRPGDATGLGVEEEGREVVGSGGGGQRW